MWNLHLFVVALLATEAYGARFSTFLKAAGKLTSGIETADPYAWELQVNTVSGHSCYSQSEKEFPSLVTIRDTTCVGFDKSDSKCRGGFPFYRFSAGPPGCVDCLDAGRCQMMCLSKGMDAAALVFVAHVATECRCGATRKNLAVWSLLRDDRGDLNFGPVHSLLPPTPMSAVAIDDPRCSMFVYAYADSREENGGVPAQFLDVSMGDEFYINQIVSGMQDPGDVEDSTPAEGKRVHAAVRERLALWLKANPTNRVPRDEIFVEQVAERHRESSPQCANVEEPIECWDDAVTSVLASNGWKQLVDPNDPNSDYTPEYNSLMLTVTYDTWRKLFKSGTSETPVVAGSGYCAATAEKCPITCGSCELYDRSPASASMYTTWAGTYKDPATGIVTIPIVFNPSAEAAPFLTEGVKATVRNAMTIWASVTCVNFQEFAAPPPGAQYVQITAEGASGCIADPVGRAVDGSTVGTITVGGCSANVNPLGSILHEFGHVLGLVHTQMRPDRDNSITMNPVMVKPGYEANFFLAQYAFDGANGVHSPYDYGSIMHYTRTQAMDMSKYDANSPTFSGTFYLPEAQRSTVVGQRSALSTLDIAEVNTVYSCNGKFANLAHTPNAQPIGSALPMGVPAENTISSTGVSPVATAGTTATAVNGTAVSSTTATNGSTVASSNTKPTSAWSGWEDDLDSIAKNINDVITSKEINLSMDQLNLLQELLDQEKEIYAVFQRGIETGAFASQWGASVVGFANDLIGLAEISKASVAQFVANNNPEQEGILDEAAIASLSAALSGARTVYGKLQALVASIPGAASAHDAVDMKHPSPTETRVVFG